MTAYDLYKPLRNLMRNTSLLPSLHAVHSYMQHLQFNSAFPPSVEVPTDFLTASKVDKGIFEWELELLAKELLINAPAAGSLDLRSWGTMRQAINAIKTLENEIHREYANRFEGRILVELYRTSHRQFPWQRKPSAARLTRYYKLFSDPALDAIVTRSVGMDTRLVYTIGLALLGLFHDRSEVSEPVAVELEGVTDNHLDAFWAEFAQDIAPLRTAITRNQSYDEDYAYAYNPMREHPLVRVPALGGTSIVCPIPTNVYRRFTEGLYYNIVGRPGFSDAFGAAFQRYVGEVLSAANVGGQFEVRPERKYTDSGNQKHTVDWIVTGASADLFIECKTARIRFASKIALASLVELESDLEKLSEAIVQTYKTLAHAQLGLYPHWQPAGKPIYPIVVTLEDWYLFGSRLLTEMDQRVQAGLVREGLRPDMAQEYPYTVCSIEDLEEAMQVMARVGLDPVMRRKTDAEHRETVLYSCLRDQFRVELAHVRPSLFPADFEAIGGRGG